MTTSTFLPAETPATSNDRRARTGAALVPEDRPGRWVGGALGAIVSLSGAGLAHILETGSSSQLRPITTICLLGVPIAFVLGRQLLPSARRDGWRHAVVIGLLFGWAAPPLGAAEITLGPLVAPWLADTVGITPVEALALFAIAIPFSFLAVFVTLPVGVAWGVLARLLPDGMIEGLRAPAWLERVGLRHSIALLAGWIAIVQIAGWRSPS
jgi:hypothetical protein